MIHWTRAIHLKNWADTYAARSQLPRLVRRLVQATVPTHAILNFPADEQVARPGIDGYVEISSGFPPVPSGRTFWEMGVDRDPKKKASQDFEKRTTATDISEQRVTTFVFATPRDWQKKDDWIEQKKSHSNWKDIVVIDANDLEHWIEQAPAVDLWFVTLTGQRPSGVIDLTSRWNALSSISELKLSPEVFLVGREDTLAALRHFFESAASSLFLRCESVSDGFDFLAALAASDQSVPLVSDRMILVDDVDAWRTLSWNRESLVLVADESLGLSSEDLAESVQRGHYAMILGHQTNSLDHQAIELPRQDTYEVANKLKACGFDEAKSSSVAKASCGSSAILKRQLTRHPETVFPPWATEDRREDLAALILLGGWKHVSPEASNHTWGTPPIDLDVVTSFTGLDRAALEATLSRWLASDEPLFLRFKDNMVVASREDAWFLLGGSVTPEMIKKFEDLAAFLLDEVDPAYELEPDKQWLAKLYGKSHSVSGELRLGILESIALMAVYQTARRSSFFIDFKGTVRRILQTILPEKAAWQKWATLDRSLPIIAEADPDFFLSRIEKDLVSELPSIPSLFEQRGSASSPRSHHCGLLWALETVAWSPEHLPRAALILARLVEVETSLKDNIGNRPSESFNAIFLCWHPYTNATLAQRMEILRSVCDRYPDAGWKCLLKMLPSTMGSMVMPTQMPRWQPWALGWSEQKQKAEAYEYYRQVGELTLEKVGRLPDRWAKALNGLLRYRSDITEKCLSNLERLATDSEFVKASMSLWDRIREIVDQNRQYQQAEWAFGAETLDRLDAIQELLKPVDNVELNAWLFGHDPELKGFSKSQDFSGYQEELNRLREQAVVEIHQTEGWEGIQRLLKIVGRGHCIGWIVGAKNILSASTIDLSGKLSSDDQVLTEFVSNYIAGAFHQRSFKFLESLDLVNQDPLAASKILCMAPFDRSTWDWIDTNMSQEIGDLYWEQCRGYMPVTQPKDLDYLLDHLLLARRPFYAADVLQSQMSKLPVHCERILEVLEAGFDADRNNENAKLLDAYAIQQLIRHLQENYRDDLVRIARIEWVYLPVLDRYTSVVRPQTLLNELSKSPAVYMDLIKAVYRSENEATSKVTATENERLHARRALELLEEFSTLPGIRPGKAIDVSLLRDWVMEVRRLASECGRRAITDLQVGELLSNAPGERTSDWPEMAIRQLLEDIGTDEVLRGFTSGIYNSRGIVGRDPRNGGDPERALAEQFKSIADNCRSRFPKLAQKIRNLADSYMQSAKEEDESAIRRRLNR